MRKKAVLNRERKISVWAQWKQTHNVRQMDGTKSKLRVSDPRLAKKGLSLRAAFSPAKAHLAVNWPASPHSPPPRPDTHTEGILSKVLYTVLYFFTIFYIKHILLLQYENSFKIWLKSAMTALSLERNSLPIDHMQKKYKKCLQCKSIKPH